MIVSEFIRLTIFTQCIARLVGFEHPFYSWIFSDKDWLIDEMISCSKKLFKSGFVIYRNWSTMKVLRIIGIH